MTVEELKNIISDLPDDMCIQVIGLGGFIINVGDIFVEEDDDG